MVHDFERGIFHDQRDVRKGNEYFRYREGIGDRPENRPNYMQDALLEEIRGILHAPNKQTARLLLKQVLAKWEEKAPKAMQILEEGFEDATVVLDYPNHYRRRLRTTNGMKRLNEEIRRRERVIRIFPNRESVYRLVGTVLIEIDEKWMTGRKYLDLTIGVAEKERARSTMGKSGGSGDQESELTSTPGQGELGMPSEDMSRKLLDTPVP
jgi:hypothetical protein